MHELYEVFPVLGGILVGLIGLTLSPLRRCIAVCAVLSIVIGTAATVISGEWRESWAYLLFDIPLVAVVAAATIGLYQIAQRVLRRSS